MSFLSTLGKILSIGEEVAGVFFPVLRPFLGSGHAASAITTGVNDFTQIASVVVGVEAAFQNVSIPVGANTTTKAALKLQAALPQVANIVKTSEALIGHKVYNNDEFIAGNQDLVNAFVRILNSYSDNEIKSSGQQLDFSHPAPMATPTPVKVLEMPAPTPEPTPTIEEPTPTPTTSPTPHPLALT